MKLQVTKVFEDIHNAVLDNKRYIFLRGSSRSSKTYSALQYLILEALKNKTTITIARSTQVSLRHTIINDFKEILEGLNLWYRGKYNKVELLYIFPNGSEIRFIGLDDSTGKLRGYKSDWVLIDEINTIEKNSFIQLDIRCAGTMMGLYNPEISNKWWGLEYENKNNGVMIHSTYKDNPFLDKKTIETIEELINIDEDMAKIYALGEIVEPREKIFKQPELYNETPNDIKETYYGIDFGFSNDPCAVVQVKIKDKNIYVKELLYDKGLTNQDLAFKLKELNIDRNVDVVGDSAEPKSIAELKREGINIRGVKKESILYSIQKMKQYKIFIHKDSINLIDEFENYKWKKDRVGDVTNTPTGHDHLLDALKYVILQFVDKPKTSYRFI